MNQQEANFLNLLSELPAEHQSRLRALWANHRKHRKFAIYHDKILKELSRLDTSNCQAIEQFMDCCEKDYQFHSAYKANR